MLPASVPTVLSPLHGRDSEPTWRYADEDKDNARQESQLLESEMDIGDVPKVCFMCNHTSGCHTYMQALCSTSLLALRNCMLYVCMMKQLGAMHRAYSMLWCRPAACQSDGAYAATLPKCSNGCTGTLTGLYMSLPRCAMLYYVPNQWHC